MWVLLNIVFHGEVLLASRPTPKLEDHPSSAVRDCLFNLFVATIKVSTLVLVGLVTPSDCVTDCDSSVYCVYRHKKIVGW